MPAASFTASAGTVAAAAASVQYPVDPVGRSLSQPYVLVAVGPAALHPTVRARSAAQAPLFVVSPAHRYTFDSIVILDTASSEVAEIARALGPLEAGHVGPLGAWLPAEDPVELLVGGFGIDGSGIPYYDTHQVDPGDEAQLSLDPVNERLWLTR